MATKRIAALFGILLLVFVSGCGNKSDEENQKRVTAAIATLPGKVSAEKVEVDGDKLVISGLKGEFVLEEGKAPMQVAIEEIACEGVDFEASKTPGVKTFASKVTVKGYVGTYKDDIILNMQDKLSVDATGRTGEMILTDVSGDLNSLVKLMDEKAPGNKFMQTFAEVRFATWEVNDYNASMNFGKMPFNVSIKHSTARDCSMLTLNEGVLEDIKATIGQGNTVTAASSTIKSMKIPNFYGIVGAKGVVNSDKAEDVEANLKVLKDLLNDAPMLIEDFVVNDVKFNFADGKAFSAEKLSWSMNFSPTAFSLNQSTEKLEIPVAMYRDLGAEGATLAKLYGKPLSLSFGLEGNAAPNNEGVFIHLKSVRLSENNLGGFDLALDLSSPKANEDFSFVPGDPVKLFLEYFGLNLQDKGLIDLVLALQNPMGATPEAIKPLKEVYVNMLRAATVKYDNLQPLVEGIASLVEKSGSLKVNFDPDQPLSFDDLREDNIVNLKPIEVEYAPPAEK